MDKYMNTMIQLHRNNSVTSVVASSIFSQ